MKRLLAPFFGALMMVGFLVVVPQGANADGTVGDLTGDGNPLYMDCVDSAGAHICMCSEPLCECGNNPAVGNTCSQGEQEGNVVTISKEEIKVERITDPDGNTITGEKAQRLFKRMTRCE